MDECECWEDEAMRECWGGYWVMAMTMVSNVRHKDEIRMRWINASVGSDEAMRA